MSGGAQEEDVKTDILFVALTRPATLWGVPYHAFIFEFMLTALIFLAIGNPLYLLLGAPLHGAIYLISANKPGAFNEIYMWVKTYGMCLNRSFWGGASFSPLRTKKWTK